MQLIIHGCFYVYYLLIKSSSIVLDVAVGPVADSDVADFSERERDFPLWNLYDGLYKKKKS